MPICLETIIVLHARTSVSDPGSNFTVFSFIFAVCWQVRHNRPCMPYWPKFNWEELCKIHSCSAYRGSATEGEWEQQSVESQAYR